MKFQTPKIAAILKASRLLGCAGVLIGAAALLVPTSHANEPLSSENYRLNPDVSNSFGGLVTSDSYELLDSGGEAVIGLGDSPSYKLSQGYVSQLEQAIELSVQPAGLAGYWPMNTGVGIQAYDMTPNNHHGVLEGNPAWSEGKVGKNSLSLDGNNDYVEVNHSTTLNITGDLTVSAWVNADSLGGFDSAHTNVVVKRSGGGGTPYHVRVADNGAVKLTWRSPTDGWSTIETSSGAISAGDWYHIVATRSESGGDIYINGQHEASGPSTVDVSTNTEPLRIGGPTSQFSSFPGKIDEVKVYNRALSADEVLDEYNASASGLPSALTLPRLDPSQSQSVDANAIVQTDAGGYHIAVEQDGDLRTAQGNAISAIESSITFPSQWNEGTTTGFGFTVTDAVQRDGKWGSSPNFEYAAVPNTSTTFHSRSGLSGGFKETTALRLRAGVDSVQAGGIYSNRLGFTATLKP